MGTAIFWFRRDLRLADNPALDKALQMAREVVPVYILSPEEEGAWPAGAASRWWLHHSLAALDASLRQRGSRLLLRRGPVLQVLRQLAAETGARQVYWNRLYEPAAIARDKAVKQALREDGLLVESHNSALLCEPWAITQGQGGPYRVFTPYWKALQKRGLGGGMPLPPPAALPPLAPGLAGLNLEELGLLPTIPWDGGLRAAWRPGEAGAWARLQAFGAGAVAGYSALRDRPDLAGASCLAPHLHFGEVGPRQILSALPTGEVGVECFVRQLCWREFAHHLLFHFPHTPDSPLDGRFKHFAWNDPEPGLLRAWQRGLTGIPWVDAGMRQLWHTGWMHNRVRMGVASFLVKNLRIHWLEGARWFWDTLVDADLANNTLGWQWVAGCGADAAPYFRIFNPVLQGERFDPGGDYVRRWLPELARLPASHVHRPWEAPSALLASCGVRLGVDYPHPIVDLMASRQLALAAFQRMKARV